MIFFLRKDVSMHHCHWSLVVFFLNCTQKSGKLFFIFPARCLRPPAKTEALRDHPNIWTKDKARRSQGFWNHRGGGQRNISVPCDSMKFWFFRTRCFGLGFCESLSARADKVFEKTKMPKIFSVMEPFLFIGGIYGTFRLSEPMWPMQLLVG